jgi:hypothetical protein
MHIKLDLTFLEHLCAELIGSDNERSEILAALSDAELKDAYVGVLRQFGLELVIGVDSHSHWLSDLLVIVANQGPIHAAATAFYGILMELERRGIDEPNVA